MKIPLFTYSPRRRFQFSLPCYHESEANICPKTASFAKSARDRFPSSPFTKGAILGDRIRLGDHFLDKDVFIRSMGSRGHLGGLAGASQLAGLAIRTVFLEVEEGNKPALRLYARAGFREVGRRPEYYAQASGAAATALVLRRDL